VKGWAALALDLFKEVGASGLLDIALMAVLLYGALSWLRASRALRVLQGVLVLGAVYVAARLFQLTLTVAALEALFVIVVVSAIVIFRDEVRAFI
jgi:DNA integrity scanning protein DisA with diadenylate cyclase activity